LDRILGVSRLDSYLVHYAGFDVLFGEGSMLKAMDRDIERWKQNPNYKYKRKIFVWAVGGRGGGLGGGDRREGGGGVR